MEHSPNFVQIINEELEKKNMKLLFWMDYGLMSFISKKPLHKLEDFKGKRIRVSGRYHDPAHPSLWGSSRIHGHGRDVYGPAAGDD